MLHAGRLERRLGLNGCSSIEARSELGVLITLTFESSKELCTDCSCMCSGASLRISSPTRDQPSPATAAQRDGRPQLRDGWMVLLLETRALAPTNLSNFKFGRSVESLETVDSALGREMKKLVIPARAVLVCAIPHT